MKLKYEFPNSPKLKRLNLAVETKRDKLTFKVKGPSAFFYRQFFRIYFIAHSKLKPVATYNGGNVYTLYIPPIPSKAHNRLFENFVRRWLYKTRIPLAVTIAVTDKCQCDCQHCSVPYYSKTEPILTLKELQKVIKQCLDLGLTNITFTGGEPLMRKDLEECLKIVPKEKAVTLVFTNAIGLTKERALSLKNAGAFGVQISLDSPIPEEHDRMRNKKGTFLSVERGVKNALDAGLMVGLSTYANNEVVSHENLQKIAELAEKWGVHEVTIFDAMPTGQLLKHQEQILTPEARKQLLKQSKQLRKKYRGKIHIISQSWTNSKSGFARFIGCLAGNYQFHISAYGDVRPCDFTPVSFGNIRNESVQTLWHKLTNHSEYHKHSNRCRMQSPEFKKRVIDPLAQQCGGCLKAEDVW